MIKECAYKNDSYCEAGCDSISAIEAKTNRRCLERCGWKVKSYTGSDYDQRLLYRYHKNRRLCREMKRDRLVSWLGGDIMVCGNMAHSTEDEFYIRLMAACICLITIHRERIVPNGLFLDAVDEMRRLHFQIPRRIERRYRMVRWRWRTI